MCVCVRAMYTDVCEFVWLHFVQFWQRFGRKKVLSHGSKTLRYCFWRFGRPVLQLHTCPHSYFTSPNFFSLFTDHLTLFLPNFATSCSPTVASSTLVLSPFPFKHSFYLPLTLRASLRTFLSPSLLSLTCCMFFPSPSHCLATWYLFSPSLLSDLIGQPFFHFTPYLPVLPSSLFSPCPCPMSFNQSSLLYPLLLFLLPPCLLVCFLSGWHTKYLSLCFSCNYSSVWKPLTCLNPFLKAPNPSCFSFHHFLLCSVCMLKDPTLRSRALPLHGWPTVALISVSTSVNNLCSLWFYKSSNLMTWDQEPTVWSHWWWEKKVHVAIYLCNNPLGGV